MQVISSVIIAIILLTGIAHGRLGAAVDECFAIYGQPARTSKPWVLDEPKKFNELEYTLKNNVSLSLLFIATKGSTCFCAFYSAGKNPINADSRLKMLEEQAPRNAWNVKQEENGDVTYRSKTNASLHATYHSKERMFEITLNDKNDEPAAKPDRLEGL